MSHSRYAQLSRRELAVLLPELLLIGQMIDRSGMAWCIQEWGRDEMVQIAIEEWAGASPIYTRRMQRALNYEGIDARGLHVTFGEKRANPTLIEVDHVVLCTGQEPLRELYEPLKEAGVSVHLIGGADVAAELDAKRAINQGSRLAAEL